MTPTPQADNQLDSMLKENRSFPPSDQFAEQAVATATR